MQPKGIYTKQINLHKRSHLLARAFGLSLSDDPLLGSKVLSGPALSLFALTDEFGFGHEFLLHGPVFLDVLLHGKKEKTDKILDRGQIIYVAEQSC